mmetsp:Transcript_31713/g.61297  ORF Transcript_31713/g.61297 Transcript_31713/m.61297 type:complete len:624 (+) Transcript_31713:102-1973(+)
MLEDEEAITQFTAAHGLGPEASTFLQSLPGDVCNKVLRSFNPRGTKDGNVFGRLQAFANSMLLPVPGSFQHQPQVAASPQLGIRPPLWTGQHQQQELNAVTPHKEFSEYAASIGLDESGAYFLEALPPEVRDTVITDFDPRGTKDGNVFGRVLGFARAVWAQRLGLDKLQQQEASSVLRSLPEDVQARVLTQFDVSGTKDGNVLARLQRFANDVACRHAPTAAVAGRHTTPVRANLPPTNLPATTMASAACGSSSQVSDFIACLGLDANAASFLSGLPEEVRTAAVTSFNPSGTKDGNVWGRFFGFLRSVWAQRLGLDGTSIAFLKSLPEETQRVVMLKFDPSRTKDGNIGARLESFARSVAGHPYSGGSWQGAASPAPVISHAPMRTPAAGAPPLWRGGDPNIHPQGNVGPSANALSDFAKRWGLNVQATEFLASLPETVIGAILASFNANGTKDGNVWGRLFGFVRSVWAQKLGVDAPAFTYLRGLPEDVQMAVMGKIHHVGEGDALAQVKAVAEEASNAPEEPWGAVERPVEELGSMEGGDAVETFVLRCGLDGEALEFLRGLDEEVRIAVISDFNPGGTKDGNIFGRLQGFARSVQGRRKRLAEGAAFGPPGAVRPRLY